MGRAVAFFGMLLGERGVLTKASLFRTRPNHVHTYFIKYPAAEYTTPKLAVKDSLHLFSPMKGVDFSYLVSSLH